MEYYDLTYIQSRVKFMVALNKTHDAEALVESELGYVLKCCAEGRADIGYNFYKAFNQYLTLKSCFRLSNAISKYGDETTVKKFSNYLGETANL